MNIYVQARSLSIQLRACRMFRSKQFSETELICCQWGPQTYTSVKFEWQHRTYFRKSGIKTVFTLAAILQFEIQKATLVCYILLTVLGTFIFDYWCIVI